MKKIISIILLLCLCFGVASCTPDEPEISYESEIIDENAPFYLMIVEQYGAIGGETITERHIPDKTIEFMGKTYTGRYDYSCTPINNLLPSFKSYYDSEQKVRFEIDDATGEIIGFSRNSMDVATEEKTKDTGSDYQKFLIDTRNMAKEYVDDLSEYDIYLEALDLNRSDNSPGYGWKVTYTKNVQGYPTSNYILISMSHSGIIQDFRIGCLGAFDSFEEEINVKKVSESIKATLLESYGAGGATVNEFMLSDEYLFKSSEGKICLLSDVTVYLTLPDGTETVQHPLVSTVIKD